MKKNLRIYLVAFLLFAGGIGYLCFTGLSENSVYFLNVAEAHAMTPDKLKQARLFGVVSPSNMDKAINAVSFHLLDKDDHQLAIPVTYSGLVPDTFKAGAEVIVEGTMGQSGQFSAKTLMTKCPSKYQNRKS